MRAREERDNAGFGFRWPISARRKAGRLGRLPGRQPQVSLSLFFSFICFQNHLNRFANPNQIKIKTTPHNKINATA
jgi:hypothetical protein